MAELPSTSGLPPLPMDEEGPVFREPWEAAAFALVLKLYQGGHFAWSEWVQYLSAEIRAAHGSGDADLGGTYYRHWLAALEKIVADKGFARTSDLTQRKAEIEANPPSRHDHVARREPVKIA
jgi:nitrile hydratase accessory protein